MTETGRSPSTAAVSPSAAAERSGPAQPPSAASSQPPRLSIRIDNTSLTSGSQTSSDEQQRGAGGGGFNNKSSGKRMSGGGAAAAGGGAGPVSYNSHGIDLSAFDTDLSATLAAFTPVLSPSPSLSPTPAPAAPATTPLTPISPPASPRLPRESSRTFLNTFKSRTASDSSSVSRKQQASSALNNKEEQQQQQQPSKDPAAVRPGTSSISKIYHLKKNPGSTSELNLMATSEGKAGTTEDLLRPDSSSTNNNARASPTPIEESTLYQKRKENRGFRNPLARSKSIRRDSSSKAARPTNLGQQQQSSQQQQQQQPPRTAPLSQDWPDSNFLRARSKEKRGKSADRSITSETEDRPATTSTATMAAASSSTSSSKDQAHRGGGSSSSSGSAFMQGSKQAISRARTGGGNILNRLGKIARSGSSHEKEVPDSEYELKIITLPLIEQTRITRISKSLDACRDKTEYWMPSLPWRCIDYLNLHCENEGLYRVPGSTPEVKHWQRRFDTELDVDLLDEQNLYDPNTVSSMLKSWLRNLPTEIMPKTLQHALAKSLSEENPDYQRLGEPVPQKLRNALSLLPPFNYYLLFAITCHLSLLLSHKERNKMDLNNLSICIGPPLDLERWLFNYLVGDWRNCWQGCFSEVRYREAEQMFAEGKEPPEVKFPEDEEAGFDFEGEGLEELGNGPHQQQQRGDSAGAAAPSVVESVAVTESTAGEDGAAAAAKGVEDEDDDPAHENNFASSNDRHNADDASTAAEDPKASADTSAKANDDADDADYEVISEGEIRSAVLSSAASTTSANDSHNKHQHQRLPSSLELPIMRFSGSGIGNGANGASE